MALNAARVIGVTINKEGTWSSFIISYATVGQVYKVATIARSAKEELSLKEQGKKERYLWNQKEVKGKNGTLCNLIQPWIVIIGPVIGHKFGNREVHVQDKGFKNNIILQSTYNCKNMSIEYKQTSV